MTTPFPVDPEPTAPRDLLAFLAQQPRTVREVSQHLGVQYNTARCPILIAAYPNAIDDAGRRGRATLWRYRAR